MKEQILTSALAGALGDALGYGVEFFTYSNIVRRFGEDGITNPILLDDTFQISDDTQMTLFTLDALLSNTEDITYTTYLYYLDWLKTQNESPNITDRDAIPSSRLLKIDQLFSERAPGISCITALSSGRIGSIENPINNSKGCGGIMRVAPIAWSYATSQLSVHEISMLAANNSALTHGHELGYISSYTFVNALVRILRKQGDVESSIVYAIDDTVNYFTEAKHLSEYTDLLSLAIQLSKENELPDYKYISKLGEGWVAEETLAIAIYCALKYPTSIDAALIAAVNHSGDSDSCASVCGQLLGASLTTSSLNPEWLEHLEFKDLIVQLVNELCD